MMFRSNSPLPVATATPTESTSLLDDPFDSELDTSSTRPAKANINVTAFRVLYTLKLLVAHSGLDFWALNQYYMSHPLIDRTFNGETITHYVNLLRQMGCVLPKVTAQDNYQYKLAQSPIPNSLTESDVALLNQLLVKLALEPDEQFYFDFKSVLKRMTWSLSDPNQIAALFTVEIPKTDTTPNTLLQKKVTYFKRLCSDNYAIDVDYTYPNEQVIRLSLEPKQIRRRGQQFFLEGIDRRSYQEVRLKLDAIQNVRQLPFKIKSRHQKTTVQFTLFGRLAHNYRSYPNEVIISQSADELELKALVDDVDRFVWRTIKYGNQCRINSPTWVAEQVTTKINGLLAYLEQQPSTQSKAATGPKPPRPSSEWLPTTATKEHGLGENKQPGPPV